MNGAGDRPARGGRVRVGVIVLPEHDRRTTIETWRAIEDLGVDHAWTYDHHSWRQLRDRPWYDALCTLSAVAAVTQTLRLGTLVSTPNVHHPAFLAKQAMTLDALSEGRFTLGLGAGALGPDARLLGGRELTAAERTSRFAEFVGLTDKMLREPVTDFAGGWFDACDARMVPGCVQSPRLPLAVAAAGRRGMALAARHAEIWVTMGDPAAPDDPDDVAAMALLARQSSVLEQACLREGRDPATIRRLVNLSRVADRPYASPDRLEDLVGQIGEMGFSDAVVAYPRPDGVFRGDRAAFDTAISQVLGSRSRQTEARCVS